MGAEEVNAFLSHLAVEGNVSASTQAQALSALVFLYRHVLDDPLPWLDEIVRARRTRKLPVVLSREEVGSLLGAMSGTSRLVAAILYGGGLRLLEALRLRIKDIDFGARLLLVREGKGAKDRRTMLPDSCSRRCEVRWQWCGGSIERISPPAVVRCGARTLWSGSTPAPLESWPGNTFFRRHGWRWIRGAGSPGVITWTNRLCSDR